MENTLKIYGKRLRELREKNEYTQEDLAKKLNISRSSVAMYEQGNRQPDFETQEAIADLFNVSIDYLFGREKAKAFYDFLWNDFLVEVEQGKVDPADIQHAVDMYELYQKVSPKVQAMVDYLLESGLVNESKDNQQD